MKATSKEKTYVTENYFESRCEGGWIMPMETDGEEDFKMEGTDCSGGVA